ncbi:MAG: PAS-domain containing protein, partial [Deltaproteobacteria bacterium]|nr:PAS-domain containing protein [Deltaproteobacteria bacterium]
MSEKNVIDLTSASQGISRKKRGNKLKSVYGLFSVDEQLSVADFNISDVVESLSDGFALYDANDNLVLWNSKFANIISHAKDILRPGVAFRELVAKCAHEHVVNGLINQEQRDIWINEACEFQRECGTYERETPDGKCYLVSRRKTSEGLIAVVWTDI